MRHTSIHSGGGVQGCKCPFGNGLRDSANDRAARAGIQTRTGGKWSAKTSVDQAEIMRHLRDIIGNTRLARQGLGLSHFQQWSKISAAERRTMDQAEVRRTEDDQRKARAIELGKQGVWIKWNMWERELTWAELWRKDQFRISFLVWSVYDALKSSVNLQQWGLSEDSNCKLCGKRRTMAHVLSGCQVVWLRGDIDGDMINSCGSWLICWRWRGNGNDHQTRSKDRYNLGDGESTADISGITVHHCWTEEMTGTQSGSK